MDENHLKSLKPHKKYAFQPLSIMKKIITMAMAVLMAAMTVNAQTAGDINFRFRGGANLSTLTNNDDAKQKIGWSIGFGLDYCLTDQFALSLDVNRDQLGCKSESLDKKLNLEYISLGPMAKFYATPWLALQAGPEIGFLRKAKLDGNSCKDAYKKTEFSLPVGFSFEPKVSKKDVAIVIDIRYRLGLSNANDDDIDVNDMKNSAFILTLGYKLGM